MRFGKTRRMARTIAAALATGVAVVGGTQAFAQAQAAQAQQTGISKEMATTELSWRRVDAMVRRRKGKLPRVYTPTREPIWVGYLRLSRIPTLGTVDPTRAARRAMWRESRRKFPGASGRQFVKARKAASRVWAMAAQRSVRT